MAEPKMTVEKLDALLTKTVNTHDELRREWSARIHSLEVANAALTEENHELIAQIAELRGYIRRADEAVRGVVELLHEALASWHDGHGAVAASPMSALEQWLRRAHVRVVTGNTSVIEARKT